MEGIAGLSQEHLHHGKAVRQTPVIVEQKNRLGVARARKVGEDDHLPERQVRVHGLLHVNDREEKNETLLLTIVQDFVQRNGLVHTEDVIRNIEVLHLFPTNHVQTGKIQERPQKAPVLDDMREDGVVADSGTPSFEERFVRDAVLEGENVLDDGCGAIPLRSEKVDPNTINPLHSLN